jgi:CBS domain-containing protein
MRLFGIYCISQKIFSLFLTLSIPSSLSLSIKNEVPKTQQQQRVFVSTPVSVKKFPSSRYVSDWMDPIRFVLTPDMSVDETLTMFVRFDLTAAPVVDTATKKNVVGMISSYDFLQKEAFGGSLLSMGGSQEMVERYVDIANKICGQKVEHVMTVKPITVLTTTPMRLAAAIMSENRIQHLPVINTDGILVGMITSAHIMKDLVNVFSLLPPGTDDPLIDFSAATMNIS